MLNGQLYDIITTGNEIKFRLSILHLGKLKTMQEKNEWSPHDSTNQRQEVRAILSSKGAVISSLPWKEPVSAV